MNLFEMKAHPFMRSLLIHNGIKAFNEFAKLLSEDELENSAIDDSTVVKALDAIFQDPEKTFHVAIPAGTELFRCRDITASEQIREGNIKAQYIDDESFYTEGYNEPNSKEAPIYKPRAARANLTGMSYLYVAEEPYTACAEIQPHNHSYISLATFRLKQDMNVVDLRTNREVMAFEDFEREHQLSIAALITAIMQEFGKPSISKSVYRVTQFVSDYIRKAGFDGVRYQSAMSAGTNITIFNCHKSRVEFVNSKILLVNAQHLEIINLESGEKLPEAKDTFWKPEYLEKAREEISSIVKHSAYEEK